jgi:zinc/manganese transport system substrate-binding protein
MARYRRFVGSTGPGGKTVALAGALLVAVAASACAPTASASRPDSATSIVDVVAGENFWGSLASQLGGSRVTVTSVVSDPNADPHEYETSPTDARAFATADLVILNGAGYDDWGAKLVAAQPEARRRVFTVATLLAKKAGDNPHFWYDPAAVYRVVDQITTEYETLRPKEAAYFAARHADVEADLAPYRARLAAIRARFSGQPVAATESIFEYLAGYLHLDLVSPSPFMKAVAEGVDPPSSSVATFDRLIDDRAFTVLVYNSQTVTPLTSTIKQQAEQKNIAEVAVSETIQPPTDTFEQWMDGELDALTNALDAKTVDR